MDKIKVMIVDDSALVRQTLMKVLGLDPGIQVIATASDPLFAAEKISREKPDVITLDLEMPRMNGLTFLKRLMTYQPIPVVIISSLTVRGAEASLKALEYGAVEVITKSKIATKEFIEESRIRLCDAVRAAAGARMDKVSPKFRVAIPTPKLTADSMISITQNPVALKETTDKLIIIGASTGGTQAIQEFLEKMPPDCPGIVIAQHMPELFTHSFAERLNTTCNISVKEGVHGETITNGRAIIAPGNRHTMIHKSGAKYCIEVSDGPLVNRHRPSVDVLFRSAAKYAGPNAIGIIMTGMGDDGAQGLLEMKQAGSFTIAQDEATCIVYGMPKVAIRMGAANAVLPLGRIAECVCQRFLSL
jgi:two-component system chemotaxis response regulator CheB